MKWFGWVRSRPIDPNRPHAFRAVDALGILAASDALGYDEGRGQTALLAMTHDHQQEPLCQVPGCRRAPDDRVHI
jgi:hypothetical protein